MSGGVFICCQRQESAFAALAIYDRVAQKVGRENVFLRLYKLAADEGNASVRAYLGDFYEFARGGLAKDVGEAARSTAM